MITVTLPCGAPLVDECRACRGETVSGSEAAIAQVDNAESDDEYYY